MIFLNKWVLKIQKKSVEKNNEKTKDNSIFSKSKKVLLLVIAVIIHNIPEGMAVGAAFAGVLTGNGSVKIAGAFALAMGIALQNLPEGAIISMPLKSEGIPKFKAFWYGILSGIVEPIFAGVTILLTSFVSPILPYLLSFAAGAMIYVVSEEIIPEYKEDKESSLGIIGLSLGFVVMMVLDVALG